MPKPGAASRLRRLQALLCPMLVLVFGAAARAQGEGAPADGAGSRLTVLQKGDSSATARRAALESLPLARLSAADRKRADEVLQSISLFRQLPTVEFEVDPPVLRFFIAHPDVAVSIWRALKISSVEMWQTGPDEFEADAGDGTVGVIEALYRGEDEVLVLCTGLFKSPLIPRPIKANALLHLRMVFVQDAEGKPIARNRISMFVSFPSVTVETAARLVSPVAHLIADRNVHEVSLFVHMMWLAMQRQPGWVERLSGRLEGILEPRRPQLLDLTARVHVAALKREGLVPQTAVQPQSAANQPPAAIQNDPEAHTGEILAPWRIEDPPLSRVDPESAPELLAPPKK